MVRSFRFRVREGHQIIEFDETRTWTRGAGYELLLTEEDAARLLRDRRNRVALELVEVVDEESATPPEE